mmetsp:Transcript_15414/g.22697  ORF Transcript_15414/g.22697 Transcript_15414/m.22697 type:complete len:263 (+) Transcript_15414:172-960(+)|eukprot:CAMPEP_0195526978 /NCGR_PEP_ID=MMETSP0794_2-20130614/28351_1 /TAXON_ID=515487 /ORGANISM="Stephanopyxis turris, Strain CCMP 815" /LENGTH=262 /DNA_ID=CAMNT_0040657783 /DNA_START=152 /DNA_END=940 /DNA_ORIENTATION=+
MTSLSGMSNSSSRSGKNKSKRQETFPSTPPMKTLVDDHGNETLNDILVTEHIDLDNNDDGCMATYTRLVTGCVGTCCTPKLMLVTMRLLKAITFCFLVLNILADGMYIVFVDILSRLGDDGLRGMVIRIYGLGLSVLAIMLELDVHWCVALFLGLKGYIPRALLLFLLAAITNTSSFSSSGYNDDNYNANSKVPNSAVVFQTVTSWVLLLCACCYFVLGICCCDRFTTKAFVSKKNPVESTVIPQASFSPDDNECSAPYVHA